MAHWHSVGMAIICTIFLQRVRLASPAPTLVQGDTPICWTKTRPPPLVRGVRDPRSQDIQEIIRQYNLEDPLRPPEKATFANEGLFPKSQVKFELPMHKRHITCLASLVMRPDSGDKLAHEYMYKVTEAFQHIDDVCSQEPGYLGGAVAVNADLAASIVGQKLFRLGSSNTSGLGTWDGTSDVRYPKGLWAEGMDQVLDQSNTSTQEV